MIISAAKSAEAATVLGVELESLTPDKLSKAYRAKAKDCHPDKHGAEKLNDWARISWANDCLRHWLKSRPPIIEPSESSAIIRGDACLTCGGTGRVNVRKRGFGTPLPMQCVMCRGSGELSVEENDSDT